MLDKKKKKKDSFLISVQTINCEYLKSRHVFCDRQFQGK